MHFVNCMRIPQQAKNRIVAESAILLFFFDLLRCFEFHGLIAKYCIAQNCSKTYSFAESIKLNKQHSLVDLHRPKMLIIQFHTLSLWKNAGHTNFIHFCKKNLIEFQRCFIVVLVSKLVSLYKKKEKKMVWKNVTHTISIYENCMIRIFFKFFFVKNSFEQSIPLLAKHLSVFWAATTEKFWLFLFIFF